MQSTRLFETSEHETFVLFEVLHRTVWWVLPITDGVTIGQGYPLANEPRKYSWL